MKAKTADVSSKLCHLFFYVKKTKKILQFIVINLK